MIRIPNNSLAEPLQTLCSIIPNRVPIDAYKYMLIKSEPGAMIFTCNGGEMQLQYRLEDMSITDTVTLCVEAKTFTEFISNMKSFDIFLHIKEKDVIIGGKTESSKPKYKCSLFPPEDFIMLETPQRLSVVSVQSSTFKDNIQKMPAFVSDKEFQPTFHNINVCPYNGGVAMMATDGTSLIRATMPGKSANSVVMITAIAAVCKKIVDGFRTDTDIIVGDRTMKIESGDYTFISTLAEKQSFNEDFANKLCDNRPESFIAFKKSDLEGIISRLRSVDKDTVTIAISNGVVIVSADNDITGSQGEEELHIQNQVFEDMCKHFPASALLGCLRAVDDGTVEMYYSLSNTHIIIAGDGVTLVQMPKYK